VAGSTHEQPQGRLYRLDEYAQVAGPDRQLADLGHARRQCFDDGFCETRVGLVVRQTTAYLFSFGEETVTRFDIRDRGFQHGHHCDRALFLDRPPKGAGDLNRFGGWLDEDFDGTVASETPAPHDLVVGGEVVEGRPSPGVFHHRQGHLLNLTLEATSRQVSDHLSVTRHHEPGPGAAIRRPAHIDDGREGHVLATPFEGADCIEDFGNFAH
jgi:hypothetical protein